MIALFVLLVAGPLVMCLILDQYAHGSDSVLMHLFDIEVGDTPGTGKGTSATA